MVEFNLKLPMPYSVLVWYRISADDALALVHLPTNVVTPYVTWRVDGRGNCLSGDYIESDVRSVANDRFAERAEDIQTTEDYKAAVVTIRESA